jgi:hypothetical protein
MGDWQAQGREQWVSAFGGDWIVPSSAPVAKPAITSHGVLKKNHLY